MKTIIFDFDGTIADSYRTVINIAYHLTKHPKLDDPTEVEKLRDHSLADIAREIKVPKYKWPYLLFRGRALMENVITQVKPFPGMTDDVKELYSKGYNLYLMSSNSEKNIRTFLINNDIGKYFQKIYGGIGLFGKDKALKRILKKNNIDPGEVIYIGDEPRDIDAAKSNQVKCIAVSWGFNTPDLLIKNKPEALIKKPTELSGVIAGWENKS